MDNRVPHSTAENEGLRVCVDNGGARGKARRTARRDGRAQPWKAHWPPKEGTDVQPAYGFKRGEVIRIWGN